MMRRPAIALLALAGALTGAQTNPAAQAAMASSGTAYPT
jgi:xanthosine utilization system XapX-like protein